MSTDSLYFFQDIAVGLWDDEKEADAGIQKIEGDKEEEAAPQVTLEANPKHKVKKPVIEVIGS
jgi:hypothetical protein